MVKLLKITEAIENLKLDTQISLEESEGLDQKTKLYASKIFNENINFIKKSLIQDGILEETQMLLQEAWTQTLMEDLDFGDDIIKNAGKMLNSEHAHSPIQIAHQRELAGLQGQLDHTANSYNQLANDATSRNTKSAAEIAGLQGQLDHTSNSYNQLANDATSRNTKSAAEIASLKAKLNGAGAGLGASIDNTIATGKQKVGEAYNEINANPTVIKAKQLAQQAYDNTLNSGAKTAENAQQLAQQTYNNAINSGKQAYTDTQRGLGTMLHSDGTPLSGNEMAALGVGAAGLAGAAGYGIKKLVRRAN